MAENYTTEENYIEVMETCSKQEKESSNTVNLEQNINVVNIDMGRRSICERIDYDALMDWFHEHIIHVTVGGVFIIYTVILVVMGCFLIKAKKENAINTGYDKTINQENLITQNKGTDGDLNALDEIPVTEAETTEELEITQIVSPSEETIETDEEIQKGIAELEPVTEIDLYELPIVGASFSEKKLSATNSVGEELENVFIISGGPWGENTAYYLNGKYDRFTANLSCLEEGSSFDVNIYLDDGPCIKTVHIQQIMAKTPIDIDVSGVTFIKFESTGSFYDHGAILSDGILHVADDVAAEK